MPLVGVRVEDAQRVLVARDVAAQHEVEHVVAVDLAADGRHGVVRGPIGAVCHDTDFLVIPCAPDPRHVEGGIEQLATIGAAHAQDGNGPAEHCRAD